MGFVVNVDSVRGNPASPFLFLAVVVETATIAASPAKLARERVLSILAL